MIKFGIIDYIANKVVEENLSYMAAYESLIDAPSLEDCDEHMYPVKDYSLFYVDLDGTNVTISHSLDAIRDLYEVVDDAGNVVKIAQSFAEAMNKALEIDGVIVNVDGEFEEF